MRGLHTKREWMKKLFILLIFVGSELASFCASFSFTFHSHGARTFRMFSVEVECDFSARGVKRKTVELKVSIAHVWLPLSYRLTFKASVVFLTTAFAVESGAITSLLGASKSHLLSFIYSAWMHSKGPGNVDRKVHAVNTVYNEKLRRVALFIARCRVLTDSECFSCFMSAIDHRVCCQIKETFRRNKKSARLNIIRRQISLSTKCLNNGRLKNEHKRMKISLEHANMEKFYVDDWDFMISLPKPEFADFQKAAKLI